MHRYYAAHGSSSDTCFKYRNNRAPRWETVEYRFCSSGVPFLNIPAAFRPAPIAAFCLCLLPSGRRTRRRLRIRHEGDPVLPVFFLPVRFTGSADSKPPTPLTLCVAGKNPFGSALQQIDQNIATVETRRATGDLAPAICCSFQAEVIIS